MVSLLASWNGFVLKISGFASLLEYRTIVSETVAATGVCIALLRECVYPILSSVVSVDRHSGALQSSALLR